MSQEIMSLEKPEVNTASMASSRNSAAGDNVTFSETERKMLRDVDYGAARLVVGIMASVFTVGLALYIFIACLVALGGH